MVREFDLASKSFMADGFTLPEAKSSTAYLDDNTVVFGTDFGPGSMTTSGYPNVVKLWHRGEKIEAAKKIFEGKLADVASTGGALRDGDFLLPIINRSPTFFESENYLEAADGTWWMIPIPASAVVQGLNKGQLLVTLREDWKAPDGTKLKKGALFSVPLKQLQDTRKLPPVTFFQVAKSRKHGPSPPRASASGEEAIGMDGGVSASPPGRVIVTRVVSMVAVRSSTMGCSTMPEAVSSAANSTKLRSLNIARPGAPGITINSSPATGSTSVMLLVAPGSSVESEEWVGSS